ncbi:MAG TPA: hypothetical protein V6C57_28025 [Coleofasciculaceae cyanobacterium]
MKQTLEDLIKEALSICKENERAVLYQLSLDAYQVLQDKTTFTTWEVTGISKGLDGLFYLILQPVACSRNWSRLESSLVAPVKDIEGGMMGDVREDLTFVRR